SRFTESPRGTAKSDSPAEAPTTIRQRSATCCGVPWAAIHSWIFCRSTVESFKGTAMTQVNTNPAHPSSYLLDTTLGREAFGLPSYRLAGPNVQTFESLAESSNRNGSISAFRALRSGAQMRALYPKAAIIRRWPEKVEGMEKS